MFSFHVLLTTISILMCTVCAWPQLGFGDLASIRRGVSARETSAFRKLVPRQNVTYDVHLRSVALRCLPLGDSITFGLGSTDFNGYRDTFVNLVQRGGPIQMIGSHPGNGVMENNLNEGWSGYKIQAIAEKATNALKAKPNLVLLLAGTNNMWTDEEAAQAPALIEKLIDEILKDDSKVALLVGTIPPTSLPGRDPRVAGYNDRLEEIVGERRNASSKVLLVPVGDAVQKSELLDGVHPNDQGYFDIAMQWAQGVNQAQDLGWFDAPDPGNGAVKPAAASIAAFSGQLGVLGLSLSVASTLAVVQGGILG